MLDSIEVHLPATEDEWDKVIQDLSQRFKSRNYRGVKDKYVIFLFSFILFYLFICLKIFTSVRFHKLVSGPPTGGGGRSVLQLRAIAVLAKINEKLDIQILDDSENSEGDEEDDVTEVSVLLSNTGEEDGKV